MYCVQCHWQDNDSADNWGLITDDTTHNATQISQDLLTKKIEIITVFAIQLFFLELWTFQNSMEIIITVFYRDTLSKTDKSSSSAN